MGYYRQHGKSIGGGGSVYGSVERPLDNEALRGVSSIFADGAHASRSERYGFVPTIAVVEGMRDAGFVPVEAHQARVRKADKHGFQRHMIRFQHRDREDTLGTAHQIILHNSHDGGGAFSVMLGAFRFVCANGLFTGTQYQEHRVRHNRNAVEGVVNASIDVTSHSAKVAETILEASATAMPERLQERFLEAAAAVRWGRDEETGNVKTPVALSMLDNARRRDDASDDIWTTFNRVQENIVRGGQRYVRTTVDDNGRQRRNRASVRAIGGLNDLTRVNRELWDLMQGMNDIANRRVPASLQAALDSVEPQGVPVPTSMLAQLG